MAVREVGRTKPERKSTKIEGEALPLAYIFENFRGNLHGRESKENAGKCEKFACLPGIDSAFLTERTVHTTASTHGPLTRHARRDAHESGIVK